MDTLKIQCQAHSLGSRAAWASIVSRHKGPAQLLRSMYAGCGSQVLCSAAIGAVYLVSFFQLKQVFRRYALLSAQLHDLTSIHCQGPVLSGTGSQVFMPDNSSLDSALN